ncbi:MAG: hypothetical protein K6F79_09035 [Saccharofermentans sp.]|nr:hypothetical protein [Saccharofermentans sp.]
MTPKKAVQTFIKEYPSLKIVSLKDYYNAYLITAYKTPDEMDPFYLVDKTDGFIRRYTIAENPSKYYDTKDIDIKDSWLR